MERMTREGSILSPYCMSLSNCKREGVFSKHVYVDFTLGEDW